MSAPAATSRPMAATALFQVTLTHEYFAGAGFGFKLAPLPSTAALGRRLGLRLVRDGSTLTLFATAEILARIPRGDYRTALAAATLCWQIVPESPEFPAFTGLDFVSDSQCLVFTHDAANAKGGSLTVGARASAKDVWSRRPLRFDFVPASPLKVGTELSIETSAGEPLIEAEVLNPSLVSVDVSAFGSGLYQITQYGKVLATWFADERGAAVDAPGSLMIFPGRLLVAAFSNALGNMLSAPTLPVYTAAYPARAVIWRYHVFNAEAGEELSIVPYAGESVDAAEGGATGKTKGRAKKTARPRPAFLPVNDPALPNARSFEAVKPLKLAQRPSQRFALNSGAATRFAPLPLAGPSLGRASRGSTPSSEIFVYLNSQPPTT